MTDRTDRLKIRESGTTEWVKKWTNVNGEWIDAGILQDAKIGEGNSFPKVANGLTASQIEQVMVMADSGQTKAANHLINVFLKQNAGAHIVHENPFKRKQLDCISFARFYNEHSGSEPPLSDEQIYDLWQEKSREK